MSTPDLSSLRAQIETINFALLDLLNQRARVAAEIQQIKTRDDLPTFNPEREQKMLVDLVRRNRGPFSDDAVRRLFKEIFAASVALMETRRERVLKISRAHRREDLHLEVRGATIGEAPIVIAGPCSVESEEQLELVAQTLKALGLRFLRGGAFKPRSSPYSFQGLGRRGLELLQASARRHDLITVSEVMDTRAVDLLCSTVDILQVGSRNMHNYELLRELGRCRKPVLLKRGLCATIDELLWSAEYIVAGGNDRVILCERGIRTYEDQTRNTLDISAVPLLRQKSFLPVVVDVSHAAGRKDILAPLGRAALAAGANGLMVEVHPWPAIARSDAEQQLDLDEFRCFLLETQLATAAQIAAASPSDDLPAAACR